MISLILSNIHRVRIVHNGEYIAKYSELTSGRNYKFYQKTCRQWNNAK
jgi:hypothetical protein